jgi:hypothetical protein
MATKKKEETGGKDIKGELLALLKAKLPQCFEREPSPAYTGHLDTLVDEIIKLNS